MRLASVYSPYITMLWQVPFSTADDLMMHHLRAHRGEPLRPSHLVQRPPAADADALGPLPPGSPSSELSWGSGSNSPVQEAPASPASPAAEQPRLRVYRFKPQLTVQGPVSHTDDPLSSKDYDVLKLVTVSNDFASAVALR